MAYTPIVIGSLSWGAPVNAAFTSQDARISSQEASNAIVDDFSLNAWTMDPVVAASASVLTTGSVYMAKLKVVTGFTTDNLYMQVTTAGGTLTAGQNFVGLYDSAGTQVAKSADQAANWGTSGFKIIPWVAPVALTPGNYYAAILTNGATGIEIARGSARSSEMLSPNLTAANLRWSTGGTGLTGLTDLPASITMTDRGPGVVSVWVALS